MHPCIPQLERVLEKYRESFRAKQFIEQAAKSDILMSAFGLTPELKQTAIQYWSRELGMCWEHLVRDAFRAAVPDYGAALREGTRTPCDFTASGMAVDTKYRLGSGDAGTMRKLANNAGWLQEKGYRPVMLILREDSRLGAIAQMQRDGWTVIQGQASFDFVKAATAVDLLTET